MRIVLADLKAADGFVSKDTVAGGYGSRLRPFSKVTSRDLRAEAALPRPAERAARVCSPRLAARAGHEVVPSTGALVDGDVAIVLSSLVDYRRETAWARADARARHARRVRRPGRVQAAAAVRRRRRTSSSTASRRPRCSGWSPGETLDGIVDEPGRSTISTPCRSRAGICWRHDAGGSSVPFAGPADRRLVSAARQPQLSGVLHLLPAPDPGTTYRARSVGNILDELSHLADEHARPVRRVSRSAVHRRTASACSSCATASAAAGSTSRSSARRGSIGSTPSCSTTMHRGGAARDELRRRGGVAGDAEEGRPPADSRRRISARSSRTAASSASSRRRSTCSGSSRTRGSRSRATIDYAVELGSTVAQFKILTPYPGTPLFKRMEPLVTEHGLGAVRRLHADLQSSDADARRSCSSCWARAYTRFYMRPSYLANYLRISAPRVRGLVARLDARVTRLHARRENRGSCRGPCHADRDLPLRRARAAEHAAAHRGGRSAAASSSKGPHDRGVRAAFADTARRTSAPSRRRTAAWRSTTSCRRSSSRPGSEIVVPALTFWVDAGNRARRGIHAGVRRRRSRDVQR